MVSASARRWIEAARIFAEDPAAKVRCPENDDAILQSEDVASEKDPSLVERYLVCPACGARNVIRLRAPSLNRPPDAPA